jgi:hypothetical protein
MNDQQLQANFHEACIHYIEQNGGLNLPNLPNLFSLGQQDGKIVVTAWRHESKQPNDTALKAYTLEQVLAAKTRRQAVAAALIRQALSLTTAQRDALGAVPVGTTIFNSTANALQIYHTDEWHTVAYAA